MKKKIVALSKKLTSLNTCFNWIRLASPVGKLNFHLFHRFTIWSSPNCVLVFKALRSASVSLTAFLGFGFGFSASSFALLFLPLLPTVWKFKSKMVEIQMKPLSAHNILLVKGIVSLDLRWKYDIKLVFPCEKTDHFWSVFWWETAWRHIFISNLSLLGMPLVNHT